MAESRRQAADGRHTFAICEPSLILGLALWSARSISGVWPSPFRLLPPAYRLLLSAFCHLPTALCLLPPAFRLPLSACCLLLFALLAASCSSRFWPAPDPSLKPVLKIEDRLVPAGQWQRYRLAKMKLEQQQDENQLLDLFVEQQIFLYLADRAQTYVDEGDVRENLIRLGLSSSEDLNNEELRRSLKDDLRVQKWIKANISATVRVSAEEAEAHYRKNSSQFVQPETVHLREILVSDVVFAGKLQRQLKKQPVEEFLRAARKYSTAPSASDDGEMGAFQRGELPPEFERVVFRLRPGGISEPVRSDLGYHLFLLEERVRRHRQRFFEVKDQIFEKILAEKERQAIRQYLEGVKRTLKVEIYRENLDLGERRQES